MMIQLAFKLVFQSFFPNLCNAEIYSVFIKGSVSAHNLLRAEYQTQFSRMQ